MVSRKNIESNKKMKINIVNKVSSLIMSEYIAKNGIFNSINELLEMQCPKTIEPNSEEHADFYFYLIFNDHGTKSINLYTRFKDKYERYPQLFDAKYIAECYINNEESLLEEHTSKLGLRYPKVATKSWIENSVMLLENFDGKAINMFNSTYDALELFKTINKFRSYGPKTSGLLLRVIIGIGFNRKLTNIENVPLPVDIHDSRIAYNCNIYRPKGIDDLQKIYTNPSHIKKIEKIWRDSAKSINVNWEELDRALWLLGSKGCANKECYICPINELCQIGKEFTVNDKNLFNY